MLSKDLTQSIGDGATGIQAGRDVTVKVGLTVDEVRSVATMAFKEDFFRLLDTAGAVAEARAERVLNQFLSRIQLVNPDALLQANDPDFRYVLFSAQKAAARSGSENLQAVLVDLLVERSKQPSHSLTQLVLNDAIEVVPRITAGQVNVLTLAVIFRRLLFAGVSTFDSFLQVMDVFLVPFLFELPTSSGSIMHLAQSGCGVSLLGTNLSEAIKQQYPGIFQQGVSDTDVRIKGISANARGLLVPCNHDPKLLQVIGSTKAMFDDVCKQMKLSETDRAMLDHVFHSTAMSYAKVKEKCVAARPYFATLFDAWDQSDLSTFVPSNVGLAIAHAQLQRYGQIEPLSHWVE